MCNKVKKMIKIKQFITMFSIFLVLFFLAGCACTRPQVSPAASSSAIGEALNGFQEKTATGFVDTGDELDAFEDEYESDGIHVADPLAGWNRMMFHFNDKFYFWILKPLSQGYSAVASISVRKGIGNFFHNITTPVRFVNCLLQLKGHAAAEELAGFLANSTVGLLGFSNPAKTRHGFISTDEDLGQTLGVYGLGNGFYIVWPFVGPSTLRDSIGMIGDRLLNPVTWVEPVEASMGISGLRVVNLTSLTIGEYEDVKEASIAPYEAIRDTYLQYRSNQISR